MLFDVQRSEREGWTVLAVVGELDLAAVPRVRHVALQVVPPAGVLVGVEPDPAGGPRVVLDLSSVDFLDSAGLGVVLGVVRRARQAGGQAGVVLQPDSMAGRVFATLGLEQVVPVAATVDELVSGALLGAPAGGRDG